MPKIHVETKIAAPRNAVFDLARNVDLHPQTMPGTRERVVSRGADSLLALGDVVTFEAVHFGVRQRLVVRISEFEAPKLFSDDLVRGPFRSLSHRHEFHETGQNECVMVDLFEFESPLGFIGSIANGLFLTTYMRRLIEKHAAVIKQMAESEAPGQRFATLGFSWSVELTALTSRRDNHSIIATVFSWRQEKHMSNTRTEKDSMGEFQVPADAYYGAQTARAVDNFPISGIRFPRPFIAALGAIKYAASEANLAGGYLDERRAKAIQQAAQDVIDGKLDEQFVVDIYQTGSGTSTNMNVNEVLSNRASEILGGKLGSKDPVHPNDHVNKGQSSNDVIPTAMHVAAAVVLETELIPALRALHATLAKKAAEWDKIVKIGRTHLMDATPIRLGQEASGWARQVELSIERLEAVKPRLMELAIGGTAVGTGINSPEGFGSEIAQRLAKRFGLPFVEATNHFEAQGAQDGIVELSNTLSTVATSLLKVANDIRWLSSGPRCGIGELQLPAVQPGSSIMPGKVNPVMCEQLMMVCAQVMGNAVTVGIAGTHGNLDLNVMLPVMARNSLESLTYLANSVRAFNEKAVIGLIANEKRAESLVEWSMSMVTSLAPVIGYDNAAKLAKRAVEENRTVRELCETEKILPADQLSDLLDAYKMTEPGVGAGGE